MEHLVCFDLISSTEAILRLNFKQKINDKKKSEIGKIFRRIYKEKKREKKENKISLEDDIINQWKNTTINKKSIFSDFIGVLNYRHWLAHGKYWSPKLGKKYAPGDVFDIAKKIVKIIE